LSESKSWTCQDFISPYCDRICSHCGAAVLMSIMNVLISLLRKTTVPPSSGNGPRCTKLGSKSFAVSLLIYTPPYHALGCAAWCFPVLRVDGFDCGFGVTAHPCHLDNLLTRLQGEELVITGLHTLPTQARRVTNTALPRFSHNRNRASDLTLDKESRPVRPDDLHIPARPRNLPHRPRRGVTLNP